MVGALGRWIRAVMYLMTGQVDAARRTLDTNPHVMRAKYDDIIRDKTGRIQQYKQAVAGLMAQQENKLNKLRDLTDEIQKLERLKAGALAKAKQRVQAIGEANAEAVHTDPDYQKCLAAYNDFSSTLAEKQARVEELEKDVADLGKRVNEHKIQLQHLAREIDKIKSEAHDAVADMITSKEEKDINDALAGIVQDGTEKELMRMRELRSEVRAEARISKEMAGTDSRVQEAEFMDYARKTSANTEFDQLLGLTKTSATTEAKPAAERKSALPE